MNGSFAVLGRLRCSLFHLEISMTSSFIGRALFTVLIGAQLSIVRAFDNSRYDNVSLDHDDATSTMHSRAAH